jgi:peptide/nickel transport system permease protein
MQFYTGPAGLPGRFSEGFCLRRVHNAVFGVAILAGLALLAALAPLLAPGDPLRQAGKPLQWPLGDSRILFGTDSLRRSMATEILYGARVSLLIGLSAALFGIATGVLIGAMAGYFGGWIDSFLMRVTESFQTVPNFILLVVIMSIVGPNIRTIIFAIGPVSWPTIARLVRSEVRAVREREYAVAAQGLGFGHARIIVVHILPNVVSPIILTGSIMVASAILTESALSFMGLGDPNTVTWGSMIGAGRQYLRSAWYVAAMPGGCIFLTALAFNLLGDGISDVLNPRLGRGRI